MPQLPHLDPRRPTYAALDDASAAADPTAQVAAHQEAQVLIGADLPVPWLFRPAVEEVSRYPSSEIFRAGVWKAPA